MTLAVLVRMREKGLVSKEEAMVKLEALARHGRYKDRMLAGARLEMEGK